MSACSTNKPSSTSKNYLVSESDKYTQQETSQTLKGATGKDLADALEFYRDNFYQCTLKANNLIDMILKGNAQ